MRSRAREKGIYGRKNQTKRAKSRLRRRGRSSEQPIRRRGRHACRTIIAKDGFGGKGSARNGNFVDFAHFVAVFYPVCGKGLLRTVRADPHRNRGNGRGDFRGEAAWKAPDEVGQSHLCFFAGDGRDIFTLFSLKDGGRYALKCVEIEKL